MMKKIIALVGLVSMVLVGDVSAQNHFVGSFLASTIRSLQVSNVAAISNLVMWPGQSNIFGGRWTNSAGVAVNVTNAGNTVQLLSDVPLTSDREGRTPFSQYYPFQGSTTNFNIVTPFTISGKLIGGAGANSTITFTFSPYWKDRPDNGSTFIATTHDFTLPITAAAGVVTFATNVNFTAWAGAKGVRVRSIVNADTDYTGGIYVTDLDLSYFKP